MEYNLYNKKTRKINNIPVECLLNNCIETEFRLAYQPLNFMDKLFLCPKFNITNSFVTPTTRITNTLIVFGALFQISTHVYRFLFLKEAFKYLAEGLTITVTLFINDLMFIIAAILHYAYNIIQSKNSVLLMIRLQQAFHVLDSEKSTILNNHKYWNWISIFFISITYGFYSFVYAVGNIAQGVGFSSIILVVPQMVFDMNIIYMIRTTHLTVRMLIAWNNKMMASKVQLANGNREMLDAKWFKFLFSAYTELIASFSLCRKIFQISVSKNMVFN